MVLIIALLLSSLVFMFAGMALYTGNLGYAIDFFLSLVFDSIPGKYPGSKKQKNITSKYLGVVLMVLGFILAGYMVIEIFRLVGLPKFMQK